MQTPALKFSLSRPPSPKELLRYSILFCVIVWGISAILVASHPGSMSVWYWSTRQLAADMFIALLSIGFLYAEYACVERYFQRELDASLGYVQSFGCLAAIVWMFLAYVAALIGGSNQAAASYLSANAIFYMLVFGEAVFIGNIFWSYVRQEGTRPVQTAPRPAPIPLPRSAAVLGSLASAQLNAGLSSANQMKPDNQPKTLGLRFDSPVAVFGSGAAFFAMMGMIFAWVGPLVTRMPIFWNGRVAFVAAGYLWMPLALPFALFAAIYWLLARFPGRLPGRQFTPSTTRIHFFCTVLMALECARVYFSWASTVANSSQYRAHVGVGSFSGAFAFLLVAIAALVWNVYSHSPRSRPISSLPRRAAPQVSRDK